ncbi:MAG: DegT/DnrJ/EryC1/StrS family aminotransferase [Actinobacteria bacterium]|nr:DegT/DnrJ/EryC1/StrS family aminotransferase [Actinomycetota bacterium]
MATPISTEPRVPFLDLRRPTAELRLELERAIGAVLDSGTYMRGAEIATFEGEFAAAIGTELAVGVASGTSAIEIALRALGVGPGDEVVTQANTCVPTVHAIARTGATPVLCDVEAESASIDPESLAAAIGPRTRAIVPVHLHGHCADMEAIETLAQARGIAIVEDCSHAHGARLNGRTAGTYGQAGCFSLYPTKNLGALGDAGAVVTSDPTVAKRMSDLAQASRMDEIQAAVLRVKLPRLAEENDQRRAIAASYAEGFAESRVRALAIGAGREHVFHHFVCRVASRERFREAMADAGVGTAIHYPQPVHRCAGYRSLADGPVPLRHAERLADEIVSLPIHPHLTDEEVATVIGVATSVAEEHSVSGAARS